MTSLAHLNAIYSTLTFLGIMCCLIPLRWHWQAWNAGTCLFMIWSSLMGLVFFINSIIWKDNAINVAPVYCDITTAFQAAAGVAYTSSFLVVNRRLYLISTAKVVRITKADRRHAVVVDLVIGLCLPLLGSILHYIGQGHRFDILENIGCVPTLYLTTLSVILFYIYPILIILVSAVYSFLAVISFLRIRRQFAELSSLHVDLSSSRYMRLIVLSIWNIVIDLGVRIFQVVGAADMNGIRPWKGWENTHSHFSRVVEIPAAFWRSSLLLEVEWELVRWLVPFLSFAFFAFFGFADEAIKNYRSAIAAVTGTLGLPETSASSSIFFSWRGRGSVPSSSATRSIPISVHCEVTRQPRQNSMTSLTDMSVADTASLHSEQEPMEKIVEKGTLAEAPIAYDELSFCDVGGALGDTKV